MGESTVSEKNREIILCWAWWWDEELEMRGVANVPLFCFFEGWPGFLPTFWPPPTKRKKNLVLYLGSWVIDLMRRIRRLCVLRVAGGCEDSLFCSGGKGREVRTEWNGGETSLPCIIKTIDFISTRTEQGGWGTAQELLPSHSWDLTWFSTPRVLFCTRTPAHHPWWPQLGDAPSRQHKLGAVDSFYWKIPAMDSLALDFFSSLTGPSNKVGLLCLCGAASLPLRRQAPCKHVPGAWALLSRVGLTSWHGLYECLWLKPCDFWYVG